MSPAAGIRPGPPATVSDTGSASRFRRRPPMGLYVHLPWCVRKCPYCDFNSFAAGNGPVPEQEYVNALLNELGQFARLDDWPPVSTIFLGGGTPSLFTATSIDRLLRGIEGILMIRPDAEITLEANPGTVDRKKFTGFRDAGVNRLSIGVQSFSDDSLARIGRIHSGADAFRAVESARAAGFDNINLDLMFGLPGQTVGSAAADLDHALSLEPGHVSRYQLTVEPNTAFAVHPPALPDEESIWTMQVSGQQTLGDRGYTRYEVSAFAARGRQCRHNRNYWEFGDYIGIGAGAHGKLTLAGRGVVKRSRNTSSPRGWMARATGKCQSSTLSEVPGDQLAFEFMLNAMRLVDGFDYRLFEERTGLPPENVIRTVQRAVDRGLLSVEGSRLAPTPLGGRFLNDLVSMFLPGQQHSRGEEK